MMRARIHRERLRLALFKSDETHRLGRVMKKLIVALMLLALPLAAAETDPLANVRFLLGDWVAAGGGKPGDATGTTTFASALRGTAITRTSTADYPALGKRAAYHHEDLMVIYASNGTIRADFYDSEGHVIRYGVTADGTHATFTSDAVAGEPRYRLSYVLDAQSHLNGTFEIAPAKSLSEFATYLTWTSHRK